jgi:mono/diheme cytochrome c family protein
MNRVIFRNSLFAFTALAAITGCDWMPGKPDPSKRWKPADQNLEFTDLYNQSCRGCHGMDGTIAGSISMDQAVYLNFIPEAELISVISNGVPGSNMPAFLQANGGTLTEEQVKVLAAGILSGKTPASAPIPPYRAPLGDPVAGKAAFGVSCASCHGADGTGGSAGSVVAPAYLGMVSDQYLRTIVVAGRPELGCPDFLTRTPGQTLTEQDVADITAWLASNRKNEFGKPMAPLVPLTP